MTEQEARQAIDQAQDVLAALGYKTYLMEVHVPTVMEQMSAGTDEEKQDAIEDAWSRVTTSWCMDANDFSETAQECLEEDIIDEDDE